MKYLNRGLLLICCLASFIPVALFPFFPSQDGPAHVYSTWALGQLRDSSPLFQHYFVATAPATNWVATSIMAALAQVTPPHFLDRNFVLTYIAVMIAAIIGTTRFLLRLPIGYAVLFFPLIFAFQLHKGSFNIALAYVLFLPFIGLCHRYLSKPDKLNAAAISIMLVAIFETHVQVVLVALVYTAVTALWVFTAAIKNRGESTKSTLKIRNAFWLVAASLPANALCFIFALQNRSMANHPAYIGVLAKLYLLMKLSGIASYTLFDLTLCMLLSTILAATAFWLLLRQRRPIGPDDCLLLGTFVLLVFYMVIPNGFDDASNVEERAMIPLLMMFFCWLVLRLRTTAAARLVALFGTILVSLQSADCAHAFSYVNTVLAEYGEVSTAMPDGSAVIAFDLDRIAGDYQHHNWKHPFAVRTQFGATLHFLGNVLAGRQVIFASDYEAAANKPYFALKYQSWLAGIINNQVMDDDIASGERAQGSFTTLVEKLRHAPYPVSYLTVWCANDENRHNEDVAAFMATVERNYQPIFNSSAGHMVLYQMK